MVKWCYTNFLKYQANLIIFTTEENKNLKTINLIKKKPESITSKEESIESLIGPCDCLNIENLQK